MALGSIGKQLLTAFVVGKEAHACYPQDGVNAAYLGAELLTEFELAAELAEVSGNEIAAPPTALHAKDLKAGYNVTTPAQSWLYWNTLQHRRSAADVFDIALMLARRAMARAARKVQRDIPVMSYAELAARVAPQDDIAAKAQELGGPHRSRPAGAQQAAHGACLGAVGTVRPCGGAGLRLHSLSGRVTVRCGARRCDHGSSEALRSRQPCAISPASPT